MFKNPLKKYQQGGQVSQEQQQMLAAFVEWLPKRVKEFQGMQPEQIVEALNGMTKSPEGQKQVQAYIQQFQQEMQNPQAEMFKEGGKLQDFICKHAKGGHVAGCGCKEDGGKVEKAEDGYKVKNGSYEASVKAPGDTIRSKQYNYTTKNMRTYPTGAVRYQTTSNNDGYTTTSWDYRKTMPTFWQRVGSEGFLSALLNRPRRVSPTTKENWENIIANHPEDPRNALKKEDGGVVKGQSGLKEFPLTGTIAAVRPIAFAVQSSGDPRTQVPNDVVNKPDSNPLARFTDEQLAKAVIAGKYGYGTPRRKFLGDRYDSVQRIVNKMLSKKTSTDAVTPASVANTPAAIAASVSMKPEVQEQNVVTSQQELPTVPVEQVKTAVDNTPNSNVKSVMSSSSQMSYPISFPGMFTVENVSPSGNFSIRSNRPASAYGARQNIVNRSVEDYIKSAGLGLGTDIIFNNGQYVWRNSGQPVTAPMVGSKNNYSPAVNRSGGKFKNPLNTKKSKGAEK